MCFFSFALFVIRLLRIHLCSLQTSLFCLPFSFILILFFFDFRQTDLCGIRWRKFVHSEPTSDPLNDPILRSYARCLQVNILSVWRRIPTKKNDPYQSHMFDHRMPNTITYPPLSLKTSKELWIFWYGEEPDWSELLVPELLKNTGTHLQFSDLNSISKCFLFSNFS